MIDQEKPDILILAEGENINILPKHSYYKELNKVAIPRLRKELRYFYNSNLIQSFDVEENTRYMIKEIELITSGVTSNILIVPVHLPSKLNTNQTKSLNTIFGVLEQKIINQKQSRSIDEVIFVGDFNLNPHDFKEIFTFEVSNCHLGSDVVRNYGKETTLYYNPSYHLLGNFNQPTLGTHWYDKQWHLLDQIIFSKSLESKFVKDSFKIIELTNNKLMDEEKKPSVSDHLPICAVFNF